MGHNNINNNISNKHLKCCGRSRCSLCSFKEYKSIYWVRVTDDKFFFFKFYILPTLKKKKTAL